jgi:hypothetical protein
MMIKSSFISLRQLLLVVVAAILLSGLAACTGSTGSARSSQPVYTAIFDAGSSGTRLLLYKVIRGHGSYPAITRLASQEYDDNGISGFMNGQGTITLVAKGKNVLPGGVRPIHCTGGTQEMIKGNAGLDVIIKDLGMNDVSPCVLEPLLSSIDATLALHKLKKADVSIELFATAGMRTEDRRNGGAWTAEQINRYYGAMKSYVANLGFKTDEFKTINGNSEEGVWTWVNLNDHYFNSFGGNPSISKAVQPPVGNFEVGGSSMQVAFPTAKLPSDLENIYSVSINGYSFNVFSKTFLGLGGDDVRKYVKSIGYTHNDGGKNCYAKTATYINTKEERGVQLYPSTQVLGVSSLPYPFTANLGNTAIPWVQVPNVPTPRLTSSLMLSKQPSFNFELCSGRYATVLDQVTSLERNKYGTFNDGDRASLASFKEKVRTSLAPFVGIDNFFRTSNYLNYAPSTGFSATTFLSKLTAYCAGQVADSRDLQNVCPNGVFMYTYLFGKAGLFAERPEAFAGVFNPKSATGDSVLSWARGYLLMKYAN